jgi:hypothetical protein
MDSNKLCGFGMKRWIGFWLNYNFLDATLTQMLYLGDDFLTIVTIC